MVANRDVFSERLCHDRRLRRVAAFTVPDLLALSYEDGMAAVEKARKLVHLMEGGQGPLKAISAAAAALYARLPLECPSDALRVLHIIETTLRYIEEGVIDLQDSAGIAVHLGAPVERSKPHVLAPANDCELLIFPGPAQKETTDQAI
jgi:hypothetical protein